MNKRLWILCLLLAGAGLATPVIGDEPDKKSEDPTVQHLERMATADRLIEMGEQLHDPSMLLVAARIYRLMPDSRLVPEYQPSTEDGSGKPTTEAANASPAKSFRAISDELIAQARKMSRGQNKGKLDPVTDLLAKEIETKGAPDRGSEGGPKMYRMRLRPGYTDKFSVRFVKNQYAKVYVRSDGATRLIMVVKNHEGHTRGSDDGKNPSVGWNPHQNDHAAYTISVRNAGSHPTDYYLFTN